MVENLHLNSLTGDMKLNYNDMHPANSHIHLPPNFSAFDSVQQAVELATEQGINVLGASNYYDFSVYDDFGQTARRSGIFPLFGLEIIAMDEKLRQAEIRVNDPGNPGKIYICGKGITRFLPMSSAAAGLMEVIKKADIDRISAMIDKTEDIFTSAGVGSELNYTKIIEKVAKRHNCPAETVFLQERHIAQAFQTVLFEKIHTDQRQQKLEQITKSKCDHINDPVKVQDHIRSTLLKAGKPCFVSEKFIDLNQATQLIYELGGIPCYPVLADGAKDICQWEQPVHKLIESLRANDIKMTEFIPNRNSTEVLTEYVLALDQAGIVVVAGTEHNTTELLPLDPLNNCDISHKVKSIFEKGICVIAGHQSMKISGQAGFAETPEGSVHAEIEKFASIGQKTIDSFLK